MKAQSNKPKAGGNDNTHFNHDHINIGHDTVGCVAIDAKGNIAAGTSTGGITAKWGGRVGDSPIIGSGVYADNLSGGISSTGHGESILKMCLAKHAIDVIKMQGSVTETELNLSLNKVLQNMKDRVGGCGGMICISKFGTVDFAFSTPRMCWASVQKQDLKEALYLAKSGVDKHDLNLWTL